MNHLLTVLHDDQGLVMVSDVHVVGIRHVLGDADVFIVIFKLFLGGVRGKIDVGYLVDALISPISDNTSSLDLILNELFEVIVIFRLSSERVNLV